MKGTLFALARNRNDIDANEKLKSMLYQVEATGAAFIDGKNILADSIFARHIQAGSITTEHMTAGSIKGDRIEVGTLNGDRITANTITSNMIHTAGLDAGVIKTGTISAGNGVSVINMSNGEFSLAGGKLGYVAATDRLYIGTGTLFLGEVPIEEHNRMVGSRQSAETQKTAITNEKQGLDARYTSLYGNVNLTGTPKTDLATKYSNATTGYTTHYNSLVSALNAVIAAPTNTTIAGFATLQTEVTTATSNYTTALFALNTALELATKTIENAVAAKAQADATAAAALDATTKAGTAETNAKTHADTKVNSIEIGGRNLVMNSHVLNNLYYSQGSYLGTKTFVVDTEALSKQHIAFTCTTAGTGYHFPVFGKTADKVGNTYTWSFYAKCSVAKSGSVGHESGGIKTISITTSWQKFTHTFTYNDSAYSSFTFYLNFLVGETLYIRDFKIEKGNKATDWTPAPEDVSTQIETKAKSFTSTPVVPYNSGDIWKNGTTTYVSAVTRLTGSYTVGDWVKVGDVTSENTAADTTAVGGTAASTIVTQAGNGAAAYNSVQDMSNDNKLTPLEKQDTLKEWNIIVGEYTGILGEGTRFGIATTAYTNAYNTLNGYVPGLVSNLMTTSDINGNTFRNNFKTYYDARQILLNAINAKAKDLADGAQNSVDNLVVGGRNFALQTSAEYTAPYSAFSGTVDICPNLATVLTKGLAVGDKVTIRLEYEYTNVVPASGQTARCWIQGSGNVSSWSSGAFSSPPQLTMSGSGTHVFLYSFIINADHLNNTQWNVNIRHDYLQSGSVRWRMFKVEKGDKPTDWTPAPEDVVAQIETKARTFTSTPVVPYNSGDIWRNGTSVYVCSTPRNTGSFLLSEWTLTADTTTAQRLNEDPAVTRVTGRKLHFTDQVLMDNAWIEKLVANSIVATKIQATDISATRITSGTISADRIAVGSLSGDKITANTIDATRLKIGSGAQGGYINNPRFGAWSGAYPDGTSSWTAGGISKVTVDTVPMAQFAPAAGVQQGMTLNSNYFANGIDLDGMQYFALECRFRLTSGTNPSGASFLVDIYRQDSSYERLQLDMKEVGVSVTTNAWYVARKIFKLADANVAKTFKSVGGYLLANWSGAGDAAKTIQFASVNMFQASAQEFLAQSWTNGGTTSINGGFIATGTLSADKITTGSLNANLITTGALNASLITTGSLDAARITAGIINAGNGKSTINMSTGAFSFGSGKIAFDGTTLSLNVDSLKITNSSVATETYASSAASTAKSEAISEAASDATSKINSIEIGGRNLWRQSDAIAGYTVVGGGSISASTSNHQSMQTLTPISAGKKLIYQVWNPNLVTSANSNRICYFNSSGTYISQVTVPTLNGTNYQTAEFVAPENTASARLAVIQGATAFDSSVKIKFEIGTKATDWTPAPEDVQLQIDTSVSTTDVEYYLSTSSTSLSGGSWVTTAPVWVNGKYMWSRTKVVYNNGTTTYKPNVNGTCIAGATGSIGATGSTGATGTGITSITEEYYLSTSKTSQTGGSWVTTAPTWSTGKYMWTRSKIVYNNPTSTEYTTAVVDSSWEAVNEIKIGGRNLVKESGISVTNASYGLKTLPYGDKWLEAGKQYTITAKFTLGADRTSLAFFSSGGYANPVSMTNAERNADGICSKTFTMSYYAGKTPAEGFTYLTAYQMPNTGTTNSTLEWVKIEEGNKATDWTPAPEDIAYEIEQKADSSATLDAINAVASSAANAQSAANSKLDKSSYDNFINEYLDYKKAIASEQSDSSKNLQDAKDAIASITNTMGDMKESWTFNNGTQIDATGKGLLLSDSAGGMNVIISNDRISFFDRGAEVAYISNKALKINNGIFTNSAQIGAHLISPSPSNPDITVVSWVGN